MTLLASDYLASRQAFRAAAHTAGARQSSYPVPSRAPGDAPLSVDVAWLGDENASSVIVIMSGVHGAEAYAGAACQRALLQHYQARYARDGVAFLLVHALNPWGYANDCRVTEANVDLNRNFIDFATLPSSARYAPFHPVLCEHYRPGWRGLANEVRLLLNVASAQRRRRFQDGVTGGQYTHPDGLFYGGKEPTPNHLIWNRIMATHLNQGQHVRFLDIHTGLGPRGVGTLISNLPEAASKFTMLNGYLDGELTSCANGAALSAALAGPLPAHVEQQLGERCCALTLEFGVTSALATLGAMRADHWLRLTSGGNAPVPLRRRIKQRMQRAFLVRTPAWEQAVLERFDWTIMRLIASLGAATA